MGLNSIFQIKDITKIYGNGETAVKALNELSLNINEGEYISFMGPSGSGKTTLINMLSGLDRLTSGEVIFYDKNIQLLSDSQLCDLRRSKIGIVFQFFNLQNNLTIAENIMLPLLICGHNKNLREEKIQKIAEIVGLSTKLNYYPNEISDGEQQLTAIARALVIEPSIILADEPTGSLDTDNGKLIINLLHKLNKERNITIIQVTHDENIIQIGDRLIKMEDGRIIADLLIKNANDLPKYEFL